MEEEKNLHIPNKNADQSSPNTKTGKLTPLNDKIISLEGTAYHSKFKQVMVHVNNHCDNEERLIAAEHLSGLLSDLEFKFKLAQQIKSDDLNVLQQILTYIYSEQNLRDLLIEKKEIDQLNSEFGNTTVILLYRDTKNIQK